MVLPPKITFTEKYVEASLLSGVSPLYPFFYRSGILGLGDLTNFENWCQLLGGEVS